MPNLVTSREQDSANPYELLVRQTSGRAIFLMDTHGMITTWNPGVQKLLGYSEEDWVGKRGHIIFTAEDRASGAFEREMTRAEDNGEAPDIRWHLKQDGTAVFIDGVLTAIRDDDDVVVAFAKIMRDATVRKRIEDALQQSELRFSLAQKGARLGIWDWDIPLNEITRSPIYHELFGLHSDDKTISYGEWLSLVHPDDRADVDKKTLHALTTGTLDCEFRVVWADRSVHWLRARGSVEHELGEARRMVQVVWDITDQKKAVDALQQNHRRLQILSDTANRLLATDNPQEFVKQLCHEVSHQLGLSIYFNYFFDEAEAKLHLASSKGVPEEQVRALEWLEIDTPALPVCTNAAYPLVLEDIQSGSDATHHHLRNLGAQAYVCHPLTAGPRLLGALAFASRTRNTWRHEDLEVIHVVAGQIAVALERARLLHELKANNDNLRHANEALKRSNQELSDFGHVVSHDLQAPLRSIKSYSQLLDRKYRGRLDGEADKLLTFVVDGADTMEQLIRSLLHYAEAAGTDRRERKKVQLAEVVDEAIANLRVGIAEAQATVDFAALPEVCGNELELVQVFQNLIGNALKYKSAAPLRIHIAAEPAESAWLISVRDNGIGIKPENAKRIFAPLKRLHGSEIPGSGLGLSICKSIVERHGGRIWVESEPGNGSVFRLTLPSA